VYGGTSTVHAPPGSPTATLVYNVIPLRQALVGAVPQESEVQPGHLPLRLQGGAQPSSTAGLLFVSAHTMYGCVLRGTCAPLVCMCTSRFCWPLGCYPRTGGDRQRLRVGAGNDCVYDAHAHAFFGASIMMSLECAIVFRTRRSHSISFTRAQGIPKYKTGATRCGSACEDLILPGRQMAGAGCANARSLSPSVPPVLSLQRGRLGAHGPSTPWCLWLTA
jgi:hypothetical protein